MLEIASLVIDVLINIIYISAVAAAGVMKQQKAMLQEEEEDPSYLAASDCEEEFIDYDQNMTIDPSSDSDDGDDDALIGDGSTNANANEDETNEDLREIFTNEELEYKDSIANLSLHQGLPSYCLQEHPLRKGLICSGGGDDRVVIFKLNPTLPINENSIQIMAELNDGHTDTVEHCCFYPSTTMALLATASMDGSCCIWKENPETDNWSLHQRIECTQQEQGGISWIQWHPKGPLLAIGCCDSSVWICNAVEPGVTLTILTDQSELNLDTECTAGRWTSDGKCLLAGYSNGKVLLWGSIGQGGQVIGRIAGPSPQKTTEEEGYRVPDEQLCPPGAQRQVQTNNHDNRTIFPTRAAVRLLEFVPEEVGSAKLAAVAFEDGIVAIIRLDLALLSMSNTSTSTKIPLLYSWRAGEKGVEFMKFNPNSLIMASLDSRLTYADVRNFTTRYSAGGGDGCRADGGGVGTEEEDNSIEGQHVIANCKGGVCFGIEGRELVLLGSRTGRISVWDTKSMRTLLSAPVMPSLTQKGQQVGGDVGAYLDEMENPCYAIIVLEQTQESLCFLASWEDGYTRMCRVLFV